jgi:hypothetical protein
MALRIRLLALGVAAGAAVVLIAAASPDATRVTMSSISADQLAADGITLSALDARSRAAVRVDVVAAEKVALANVRQGAATKESVLARVQDSQLPAFDHVAWVISVDGAGLIGARGPGGFDLTPATTVLFIDAQTGDFLFGIQDGPLP